MDDLRSRRSLTRLALLAAISCCGPVIGAEDNMRKGPTAFRSLIAQGWKQAETMVDPSEPAAEPAVDQVPDGVAGLSTPATEIPVDASRLTIEPAPAEPIEIELPKTEQSPVDLKTQELPTAVQPAATAIAELASLPLVPSNSVLPAPTAQEIRLQQSARESLRLAKVRLQRRATHSAKMYATDALRSIVAMQDAANGGNLHSKKLVNALDAIRESQDFSVHFGAVDQNALRRMVTVHETEQLKGRDLENLTSLEATTAYLQFAQQCFVEAARGSREASDALMILGRVERETAAKQNSHALAVSAAMQQAAIQIAPDSMVAYRELGLTLGQQGLLDQSAQALKRSIEIQPSREAYQRLMELAHKSGDRQTAEACLVILRSDSLPSEIPVRTMAPSQFAATYRPTPATVTNKRSDNTDNTKSSTEPIRIGFRSILPFGRK